MSWLEQKRLSLKKNTFPEYTLLLILKALDMIHTGGIEENGESSYLSDFIFSFIFVFFFLSDNQNYSLPTQLVCSSKNALLHAKQLLTL